MFSESKKLSKDLLDTSTQTDRQTGTKELEGTKTRAKRE